MVKGIYAVLFAVMLLLPSVIFKIDARSAGGPLVIGDPMPAFSLTDQNGKTFNSADYVGKSILVIYFYPKDESMVCTREACAFRDSFDKFVRAGAKVIGINGATVASHKAFSDHYKLPFILLSDPGNKVYHLFGVRDKMFMTGRETFVIGRNGKVEFTYESMMEGRKHAEDALANIQADGTAD